MDAFAIPDLWRPSHLTAAQTAPSEEEGQGSPTTLFHVVDFDLHSKKISSLWTTTYHGSTPDFPPVEPQLLDIDSYKYGQLSLDTSADEGSE